MQGVQKILDNMGFDTECVSKMVQQIRTHITVSSSPIEKAKQMIKTIADVDVTIPDIETAVPLAQFVAKTALEEEMCDFHDVVDRGFKYVSELFEKHPWSAPRVETQSSGPVVAVVEGIDVKVEVKADGKIKKGGKQILAAELYKKHVTDAEKPLTNQEFIAKLMKELGMSKAGATTYAYNCKKAAQS